MDKHLVLLKFFKAIQKIQKYHEENPPVKKEYADIVSKISNSGRNILCLLLNSDTINQRNIAKNMEISSQAVSESIKKLEIMGLIKKSSGLQNNENLIKLTDLGEIIATKLDFKIKDHAEHVFQNLSDQEIEQLFNLLNKIA